MKTTRDVYVCFKGSTYLHVRLSFEGQTPLVHSLNADNPAPLHDALVECSQIISKALKRLRDENVG